MRMNGQPFSLVDIGLETSARESRFPLALSSPITWILPRAIGNIWTKRVEGYKIDIRLLGIDSLHFNIPLSSLGAPMYRVSLASWHARLSLLILLTIMPALELILPTASE